MIDFLITSNYNALLFGDYTIISTVINYYTTIIDAFSFNNNIATITIMSSFNVASKYIDNLALIIINHFSIKIK